MRVLSKEEMGDVAGGFFWCWNWSSLLCKPKCEPAPKCTPKPTCEPKPTCDPKPKCDPKPPCGPVEPPNEP